MEKFRIFVVVSALLLSLISCREDNILPIDKNDSAPGPVNNIEVKNLPGGATITYDLPDSKSLLYVKAEFMIGEDNKREVKSSLHKNSLTIEGFPDTSKYEGKVYAVSRGEKESEPVAVTVQPLTPPVVDVFKSISMQATFGGVRVDFQNDFEEEVVLDVLAEDSVGNWTSTQKYYTQIREGTFAARGFSAEQRRFGVYVRDRWDNYSDTTYAELLPLFEEELDKSNFQEVNLPGDTYEQHCCGEGVPDLWDEVWADADNTLHTKPNTGLPQWFTLDLGVTARLSRFKLHHRDGHTLTGGAYHAGDPKVFEIWGSTAPAQDGSWDSWTKLATFESIKPSGEGPVTNEDLQYATAEGEDFEFPNPENAPAIRYLRFKTNENWGGVTYIYLSELTFWGSIVK